MLDHATVEPLLGEGVFAWTTTRASGSLGLAGDEPIGTVYARWETLQEELAERGIFRLATAHQVHGASVARHDSGWTGWLRQRGVDGHVTTTPGTALAVTIADCTPVFIAHPAGAVAVLHAGWRGAAAHILSVGLDLLEELGAGVSGCRVHLGPAICAACYEVGPEVLTALHRTAHHAPGYVDVRDVLEEQAAERGVSQVSRSASCTRCDPARRYFSHRGGDAGRQLGIIAVQSS